MLVKITRLSKAKGYRIFRDFSWPANGLPDFGRFNVIYGWNGTGKTSLSNIFRHAQQKQPLTEGQIEISIDQTRVVGENFSIAALPEIRTFNRDTVSRNIFETPNQQFPPVFYLGEDSVEKQKRIEHLKNELAIHVEAESKAERKRAEKTATLDALCADEARGIKNLLTVAGGGPYNNYNAGNFKTEIQTLASATSSPNVLTDAERQKLLATKESKAMDKLSEPAISFPDLTDLTKRAQAALSRSVVSAVIEDLADNPTVAAWVQSGLSLHKNHGAFDKCQFCNQTLPKQRVQQLEAHFNNEFHRFQAEIDRLIDEVRSAQNFSAALRAPHKEALYPSLREDYEKAASSLKLQANTVSHSLDALLRALQAKRNEPFKNFTLNHFFTSTTSDDKAISGVEGFFQIVIAGTTAISAVIGKTAYEKMRAIIAQHNLFTDSFDVEIKKARWQLAQHELLKALPEWKKRTKAVLAARENAENSREIARQIRDEIATLEVQVLQHRRPAEELNQEVSAYLGRDELQFEVEQNGYRITRGGQPAVHLSEGERTAIAFLYFLKSLQSTDFDLGKGIVVIDDPVSSLDANSLFSAFGFMKQRTSTAGQLFVLTHNFAFFRQVRNWYYNLPGQKKKDSDQQPARFYMLTSKFSDGNRSAVLEALDPFLHQYESEYHYLFKRVHEEAYKPGSPGLESYYAIPNIARRLLESFLAFRIPDKPGELFQKLESIEYDAAKKTRILRFLHTYSHFDQVSEPGHDLSVLSEAPAVLQDVLALIKHCDADHFSSMMELISPSVSSV